MRRKSEVPSVSLWLLSVILLVGALALAATPTPACCPARPISGKPVVNADQSVVLIWDEATKTEHFIRRASFQGDATDFGFVVPSPSQPELSESGNEAFPYLQKITEPEHRKAPRSGGSVGCGCGLKTASMAKGDAQPAVRVLEEKVVAGYKASVLEADSSAALVRWFKDHGYAFSPEVEAWAKPYVEGKWKFTALKIDKPRDAEGAAQVGTQALRLSFKTDRPLFPYREPNPEKDAEAVGAKHRLLRIYFISDAKYFGELKAPANWTGQTVWAGEIEAKQRAAVLELLNLPPTTGPAKWWLTEFEDDWPYRDAPSDVYFVRGGNQNPVRRPPIYEYTSVPWPADGAVYLLAFALVMPPVFRRFRRAS